MFIVTNTVPIPVPHGRPLTQLEFARQSAELLAALHDAAGVMHLDLRLDNFVITDHGVGFVDFGSAVRVGEEFPEASLLSNLFVRMQHHMGIEAKSFGASTSIVSEV
jgi:serine/threonine protein kinase